MKPRSEKTSGNTGSKFLMVFGRILALLVALLLCIPVFLLPFFTAVPLPVSIALAVIAIGLIILQFRSPATGLAGTLMVCILAVLASQFFAATPEIKGANGQPLPGSIATLEKVNLNGTEQWITIRGHDNGKN